MKQTVLIENEVALAKPFIKWAGGKQALADQLISFFPVDFDSYYEPFTGGGGVFFSLAACQAVLADSNEWLIDTYSAIQLDWQAVATLLDELPNEKEAFLKIRSAPPGELPLLQRAAHFIYLNKTCFRGLFRVNKKGHFNVPYGAYNRRYYDPDNLERVSSRLRNVELRCGDFEMGLDGVKKGDFIYLDPPYFKLGGYSDFNRYTSLQFKESDHIRLAALCMELDQSGIKWAVSNSNTAFVRRLYKGFNVRELDARREINLNSQNRNVKELLMTNY
jgi:DNA adenine methylase